MKHTIADYRRGEVDTVEEPPQSMADMRDQDQALVRKWVPAWSALGLSPMQAVVLARACEELSAADRARGTERHFTKIMAQLHRERPSLFVDACAVSL